MGNKKNGILRHVPQWKDLWFYQKSEVLYQLTYKFCERFLPPHGDRTVDQMVQAARSGKQNIVEGLEDGKTSTEMELKLLNVARASIAELRQDFEDYLKSRSQRLWGTTDERFQAMQQFTKQHNALSDYEPYFTRWTSEEMANVGTTLCFQVDAMLNTYLTRLEQSFTTEGGIKERMHNARTGHRQSQAERIDALEKELAQLRERVTTAETAAEQWKAAYDDLKQRALKAYQEQQQEIAKLRQK